MRLRCLGWMLGAVLCGVANPGFAQQAGFPFDSELVLDANPLPGSKRVPNMDVAANGAIALQSLSPLRNSAVPDIFAQSPRRYLPVVNAL